MFTCRSNQLFFTKEFLVLPIGLTCSKRNIYQGLVQPSNLRFGISAIFITYLALENKLPESFQGSLLAEHTKFHQYPVQGAVCKILNKLRLASSIGERTKNIHIQLPNLLHNFPGLSDNVCSGMTDNASHLHRIPPSTEKETKVHI